MIASHQVNCGTREYPLGDIFVFCKPVDGDVPATYANVEDLVRDVGYRPDTPMEEGVARFVAWYKKYYQV